MKWKLKYVERRIIINNKDFKKFINQINLIEDYFYGFMKEKGYSVNIYEEDDLKYLGYGGWATKEDKFAIFFKLVEFPYPKSFSIHAEDRNGNNILHGETVAIYSISDKDNMSDDELLSRFKMALNDIYDKYKVYSKENRLDFVFNELEMERKDYTDMALNIKLEKNEIEEIEI